VLVGGVGIIAVVLIWMGAFPQLRHVDGFHTKKI
jgi:hypothetical protein